MVLALKNYFFRYFSTSPKHAVPTVDVRAWSLTSKQVFSLRFVHQNIVTMVMLKSVFQKSTGGFCGFCNICCKAMMFWQSDRNVQAQ